MQKKLIIKRYHRVWWWWWWCWWYLMLIVINFVYIQNGVHVKGILLDVDENVVHKICQMKFCDASKSDCGLEYCLEQMSTESKFGECTTTDVNKANRIQSMACFDDCNGQDYRCSAAGKCCWNKCNRSCESNIYLDRIPLLTLPAIPINVTIFSVERETHRTAEISWLMRSHHNRIDEQIGFVIEARAHVGYTFSKHKLSQWFIINGNNVRIEWKHLQNHFKIRYWVALKIGRFYEFRILSLNGNGTRGYSTISQPFQLDEKPKHLPIPIDYIIDIQPVILSNNSIYTKLSWKTPISDYPIETYEFTWSRFIQEGNGSLWMEKASLPEARNHFELWDLLPNHFYYMQINALSNFGRKRIRSEKASIFLNTSHPTLSADPRLKASN